MSAQDYQAFSKAVQSAPQPDPAAARAAAAKLPERAALRSQVILPSAAPAAPPVPRWLRRIRAAESGAALPALPEEKPRPEERIGKKPEQACAPEQTALEMPAAAPWRMVGELYRTYILVEQGDEAFLIDKHAAHERILFNKLKAHQEAIVGQTLLTPIPVRLNPKAAAEIVNHADMMEQLGFSLEEFGENTLLLRQIPHGPEPG